MQDDRLYQKLQDPAVIQTGWHLAHGDSRDDFATDPLAYADFAFLKEKRFQFIIEQIRNKRHRLARVIEIELPKGDLSVRPGNVLPIEESTILHAAIYLIAPIVDKFLGDGVYSYRVATDWKKRVRRAGELFEQGDTDRIPFLKSKTIRSISLEEPWYNAWPEFDAESVSAVKKDGFTHLTKTDISSYFENIDLALLEAQMRKLLPREEEIVSLIVRMLEGWTRRTVSGVPICRGIPQGNDVSSFLGNMYLIPLDNALAKFCEQKNAKWFRYVDDVKVFTRSYEDARHAVFVINESLRSLHLNLQSAKTKILHGEALDTELHDPQLESINEFIRAAENAKTNKKESGRIVAIAVKEVASVRRKLAKNRSSLESRESRLLRRTFTLLGILKDPRLASTATQAVRQVADVRMIRSSLGYLSKLPERRHSKIATELLHSVEASELLFPYQIATVIESFKILSVADATAVASRIRKAGWRKSAHWYVRQKSLETIAYLPYRTEYVKKLVSEGLADEHPWVRRAAAALLPRLAVEDVRARASELCFHPDPDVARIALYWRRHIEDSQDAMKMLSMSSLDWMEGKLFLRRVPLLYMLRCNQDRAVGQRLKTSLEMCYKVSKHTLVKWHCNNIIQELSMWIK